MFGRGRDAPRGAARRRARSACSIRRRSGGDPRDHGTGDRARARRPRPRRDRTRGGCASASRADVAREAARTRPSLDSSRWLATCRRASAQRCATACAGCCAFTVRSAVARVACPRATPIVAVYDARRAARLRAVARGGPAASGSRARFSAATRSVARRDARGQVFYPRDVRWLRDPDATSRSAPKASHSSGAASPPVLLMPQVARDHGVDARGLLALLAAKAGLGRPMRSRTARGSPRGRSIRVVARADEIEAVSARAAAAAGARATTRRRGSRAWSTRAARSRSRSMRAPRAPAEPASCGTRAARSRSRRSRHTAATRAPSRARAAGSAASSSARSRGQRVEAGPRIAPRSIGTVALACLAGVPRARRLASCVARPLARARPVARVAVACRRRSRAALGRDTPRELWAWCVDGISRAHPFAPYTALAARAMRRRARLPPRNRRGRQRSSAAPPPHRGGASATALPETALTAVAAQRSPAHARTAARTPTRSRSCARASSSRARIPAALDPALALGGFAATPVDDMLRADITGHALLALEAHRVTMT